LAAKLVDHVGFKILDLTPFSPYHIIILAQKNDTLKNGNDIFTTSALGGYKNSCFHSDRLEQF
jgi:hypothetical protein